MMLPNEKTWPHGVICGHTGGLSSEMGHCTGMDDLMSTMITSSQSNMRSASDSNCFVSTAPAAAEQAQVRGRVGWGAVGWGGDEWGAVGWGRDEWGEVRWGWDEWGEVGWGGDEWGEVGLGEDEWGEVGWGEDEWGEVGWGGVRNHTHYHTHLSTCVPRAAGAASTQCYTATDRHMVPAL
jgi:hypothetical protein